MDISSLRERVTPSELTVSELNAYIKRILDADKLLGAVSVRGEISNLTLHRTGHIYFSLKDEGSQIKCVMFRSSAERLKFIPENGMRIIVRASVSVYQPAGSYQLYVTSMQPDGIGALYLAYEQLKSKLSNEGLFSEEYKKPIPEYPESIGIITSPTGAAVRDMINVTGRRFPLAKLYLYPSLVQGDNAEDNLIKAVEYLDSSRLVDVIIIGRGGGSIEDLWAFNGEKLARAIFACQTPIISAVGHETDFTICDFVADLRAPTPSAAAEIAVPDVRDIQLRIAGIYDRCQSALTRKAERYDERLLAIKNSIFSLPESIFSEKQDDLSELYDKIKKSFERYIEKQENSISSIAGKLHVLSPLATLARGYSVAYSENGVIKDIADVNRDESITVRVCNGSITAKVIGKEEKNG